MKKQTILNLIAVVLIFTIIAIVSSDSVGSQMANPKLKTIIKKQFNENNI